MLTLKEFGVAVSDSFNVEPFTYHFSQGDIVTILGESGSGKTTLGKGLSHLLDSGTHPIGQVLLQGEDIYAFDQQRLKQFYQEDIAMAFQLTGETLNPRLTVQAHLAEVCNGNPRYSLEEWLNKVNLEAALLSKYPKQLSGGEAQRINLLLALIREPKVVILDEPTSALDDYSASLVMDLIEELNTELQITFIIITHHVSIAYELKGTTMVMYDGSVVEIGPTRALIDYPEHPYTRGLFNSSTEINPYKDIWGIKLGARNRAGCPFYYRCTQAVPECKTFKYHLDVIDEQRQIYCYLGGIQELLSAHNLSKSFDRLIVDDVSLQINQGEMISIVGESGCGKTTLLNSLLGFVDKDAGAIDFKQSPIDYQTVWRNKGSIQYVQQDASDGLNPNFTVEEIIREPLILNQLDGDVDYYLSIVGLETSAAFKEQKVRLLSGGQKQRVAMARSLIMEPVLLVADEPTSMLDPSNRANVLNLLKNLQNQEGFAMLMVSHDLDSVVKISDRVYELVDGKLVEYTNSTMAQLIK